MHFLLETYTDIPVVFMVVLRIELRALMCTGRAFSAELHHRPLLTFYLETGSH